MASNLEKASLHFQVISHVREYVAKNTLLKSRTKLQYDEAAKELSPELKNLIKQTLVPMLVKQYIQDVKSNSPDLSDGKK